MSVKEIIDLSRKISFNYEILKRYEAGVVLLGWEVGSIRLNSCGIFGSYLKIKNLQCWIIKSFVKCNSTLSDSSILENRDRKLLFHKKEIASFVNFLKIKTHTIVPSKVYWKNNLIKLEVCLCVGKKKYDKRLCLKNKEWNLDKAKILKNNLHN